VRLRQSGRLRVVVLLGLLALVAGVLLQGLGVWPLMEPDEGRNAEVAREMLQSGHWSVPHFNGLPYLDKPVLLFWLIAAAFHVLGVSELAARLPSVLGALATIVATYDLGRVLAGRRRALVAAMVMATTPMLFVYAHLVIFDSVLTALVTGALCCLVRARVRGNEGVWLPLAGVAMGAATLTKGPVGVAVPLLAWWAARGALPKARAGRRMVPVLLGVLAFVAVVGPWVAVVVRQQPDFLRYALLDETALRLVSTKRFNRGAPFYFYPVTLAWALGVWGIVLVALTPRIVRRHRAGGRDAMVIAFALRATAAIVIFFTLSASKRPHYIFPALAPLAVLAAVMLTRESATAGGILRAGGRWAALAGVVVALVGLAGFEGRGGEFVVLQPAIFMAAGIFLVAWGALTALVGRRPAVAIACGALFAPGLGLVLLGPLTPYAEGRSSRALAASIEPDAPVVCFDTFRTSLPFYLRRPIMLASDTGRALTSNYVVAARDGLDTADHLIPLRALRAMLATSNAHVIVASRWNAAQVTRLSPRPLLPVYSDKSSIVFQQRG
jgi:4-amino-4-deoxy-L-arabinose transferase-like glycosyltransferase